MNILENIKEDKLLSIAMLKLILDLNAENGICFNLNISELCKNAGANRTQMYEKKKHIEKALIEVTLPGQGCPVKKNNIEKDSSCDKLMEKVLRYRLDHPGAVVIHESGQASYSNGFKRFILDLTDEWKGFLDSFCIYSEVPYPTLRKWLQQDQKLPFNAEKTKIVPKFEVDANDIFLMIVNDYAVWEGSIKEFFKFEKLRLKLPANQIYRVLVISGMLPVKKSSPRYRGSTEKVTPGSILVTDGKMVKAISTATGETSTYNWQGMVDQTTATHTATVITDTECANGVKLAFKESCQLLGRTPDGLLHDNKPIHNDAELRDYIEKTTVMIPATPNRGQNKAVIEGEFGKFSQAVGTIRIDDSSIEKLKKSAVSEIVRAYTSGINHAGRVEFDGKSRLQELRNACPDPEKDKKFVEQLRANHSNQSSVEVLCTQETSRKLLDHGFIHFNIEHLDPHGKLRTWLSSRYTPMAIKQALAIFGTARDKGRLQNKTAHRYLVKVIQSCQEELDLKKLEQQLLEFSEIERQAWLKQLERDYEQIKVVNSDDKTLAFRISELSVFGGLILHRVFWENKLKALLLKQHDLIRFVSNHVRRLFEATQNDRFQLISKLTAWEYQVERVV